MSFHSMHRSLHNCTQRQPLQLLPISYLSTQSKVTVPYTLTSTCRAAQELTGQRYRYYSCSPSGPAAGGQMHPTSFVEFKAKSSQTLWCGTVASLTCLSRAWIAADSNSLLSNHQPTLLTHRAVRKGCTCGKLSSTSSTTAGVAAIGSQLPYTAATPTP
jgi:hypothetical protein